MKQQLQKLSEKFDAFCLRERALVGLLITAALWLVWDLSLGLYQRTEVDRLKRSMVLKEQAITREIAIQAALQREKAKDPTGKLKAQRQKLKIDLADVQQHLKVLVGRFVDPKLMPTLLEDVLARNENLSLTRLSALPVKPMQLDEQDETTVVPGLYRHGMTLEVRGRYFDIVDYLGELENSRWEFIWRDLDYRVDEYPNARVQIELETLSQEKNWLGV